MRKCVVAILLPVIICVVMIPRPAIAQGGIKVWPTTVEFTVDEGDTQAKVINIQNLCDEPVVLKAYAMDFWKDRDGGFLFMEPGHQSYSASSWLDIAEFEAVLLPFEERQVEVAVSVPVGAEPGGHFAALFFEVTPPQGEGTVSIATRIPTLFYVTIPGVTEREVVANADIVSLQLPSFAGRRPVEVGVLVRNSGNVHLTVAARAHFASAWGNASELNLGQVVILPGSEAVMRGALQETPLFGRVKASVVIGYLDQDGELVNKSETAEFWVVPWSLVGIIAAVIGVVVPALLILSRRYRLRLERR